MVFSFHEWLKFDELNDRDAELARTRHEEGDLPFDNLFPGGVTRVVLPIESRRSYQHVELERALTKEGFSKIDWDTQEAIKIVPPNPKAPPGTKPKETRVKIGKAISYLPNAESWKDWWSQQGSKGYSVVISRNPIDVLRMSDHKGIESCHSPGGSYYACAKQEMQDGGLVAFAVKTEDIKKLSPQEVAGKNEIFRDDERGIPGIRPISRLRLRHFHNKKNGVSLAIPEEETYGNSVSGFEAVVKTWARESQPTDKRHKSKDFELRGGSYEDSDKSYLFNSHFGDEDDQDWSERNEENRVRMSNIERDGRHRFRNPNIDVQWEDGEGDDEETEISFQWHGTVKIPFASHLDAEKEINPKLFEEDGPGSLNAYLTKSNCPDIDSIDVQFPSHGGMEVVIYIKDDNSPGEPNDFDAFIDTMKQEYADDYKDVKDLVAEWMESQDYIHKSPAGKMWDDLENNSGPQLKYFAWKWDGGGFDLTAHVPLWRSKTITLDSLGYFQKQTFENNFKTQLQERFRQAMTLSAQQFRKQGHFAGFDDERSNPFDDIRDLDVTLITKENNQQTIDFSFMINIRFESEQDEQEIDILKRTAEMVDKSMPLLIQHSIKYLQTADAAPKRSKEEILNGARERQRRAQLAPPPQAIYVPPAQRGGQ